MRFALDTTVLVDHLRNRSQATALLSKLTGADVEIIASELNKIEILAGTRPNEIGKTEALLSLIAWQSVDDEIARRAGAYAARYRRSHNKIDVVDFAVAATAELLDAHLLTGNRKHFPMFPDLVYPYSHEIEQWLSS